MAIKKVMKLIQAGMIFIDGCDISYYQGDIDFEIMKAAGIKVVIIRAGYGTTVDKRFISYINGAIKAGLAIGVYWFIYARDMTSVRNNAKKCLEVIAPYKEYIECGVWADWEYDSDRYAGTLTPDARSNMVDTFNKEVEVAGYEPGIYSNQDYIQSGKFNPQLISRYPLWFAKYSLNIGNYANKGKQGRPYLWQYSSSGDGATYGVTSKLLDLNKVYLDIMPEPAASPAEEVSQDPGKIKASDNPYPEPTRTIYYTAGRSLMYGDDVKWVQWHLWRFGLLLDKDGIPDAGQIDGKWGSASDRALEVAQVRLKLQQDKKCGPLTRQTFKQV
ncbi:MAG: peptidoglycan-binding protein [Lachnospiraceae bacterium]|nr:peptidoglycan-binding protein [Lachnospiraceae bacterium]MDE7205257.1 peptidoglycan-binding protein [Lachnospiraceae bacterium]